MPGPLLTKWMRWNCRSLKTTQCLISGLAILDAAVQLAGCTIHRQDRNKNSGKTRGGGICFYVHNTCCPNSRIIYHHCFPDIEALSVICRPLYLLTELTVVIITAVYVPTDANVSTAHVHLQSIISKQLKSHRDRVHIIVRDFNQACLKTVFPEFIQHVKCATRGQNTLDHVSSDIKHAFPFHILDFQTILHCSSSQLTPPLGGEQGLK